MAWKKVVEEELLPGQTLSVEAEKCKLFVTVHKEVNECCEKWAARTAAHCGERFVWLVGEVCFAGARFCPICGSELEEPEEA